MIAHTGASRGGYEKAEKDLMATKRKRLEDEAESNPSTVVDRPPSPIRREECGCIFGKSQAAPTLLVIRILREDLKKKEREDLLRRTGGMMFDRCGQENRSLGRVRAIGGRVGLKQYFDEGGDGENEVPPELSAETSVDPLTPSVAPMQQRALEGAALLDGRATLSSYVEDRDGHRQLVAKGTVHNLGSAVHHEQMGDDEVECRLKR
ncbi:hypothetical protein K1719_031981 [Acacia pycnantha]|nr:hypothetical protein K1719_031981 [Acacia pycnantha]